MRHSVRHSADRSSSVTVTHKDDILKILELDEIGHIQDKSLHRNRARHQMASFTKSGLSRRVNLVTSLAKETCNGFEAPPAVEGAVNEHKR